MSLFVTSPSIVYGVGMEFGIRIDQPNLDEPGASRRLHYGRPAAPSMVILNGTGSGFDGGSESPELSLKWMPRGIADYRSEGRAYRLSGSAQLLLNRGQPYRLNMRGASESFVLFFPRAAADAAWQAQTGTGENLPEVPTAAGPSPANLQSHLAVLRAEARAPKPDENRLQETCWAVLAEIVSLAMTRRGLAMRIPAARRATREELVRRLLRAQTYLAEVGAKATLAGAAEAAALSPFHLVRLFTAAFGETPLAHGTGLRLERAHCELANTRRSVAEIAEAAGYESRTAFDRAFARRYGATPGAVRAAR